MTIAQKLSPLNSEDLLPRPTEPSLQVVSLLLRDADVKRPDTSFDHNDAAIQPSKALEWTTWRQIASSAPQSPVTCCGGRIPERNMQAGYIESIIYAIPQWLHDEEWSLLEFFC